MKSKVFFVSAFLLFLVGCGFHLRGAITLPSQYKTAYIMSESERYDRDSLAHMIQTRLGSSLTFLDSPDNADLEIIIDESYQERAVASNIGGQHREYTHYYRADISVVDKDGHVIMPRQNFSKSKDFSHDESDVLGKAAGEAVVKRELAEDLSMMFVRRLTALLEQQ